MGKLIGKLAKAYFTIKVSGVKHKLDTALEHPFESSCRTLRDILTYCKDTEYARDHDFDYILSAKDDEELLKRYREKIQAGGYENFRPYVDKHLSGKENVLVPGKPFLYATTSGTTAKPKFLPLSWRYRKVSHDISSLWFWNLSRDYRNVAGKLVVVVSPDVEGVAKDGVPVGSISGYTQATASPILKAKIANPYYLADIKDYTARYYCTMRKAIECKDVSLIVTANPSTITELLKNADEFYDEYIKDIENGTISNKVNIEPQIREVLQKTVKPNRKRAAELRAIKEKYGHPEPKHYWPEINGLNTWKCGNTPIYIEKFINQFPKNIHHIEIGYFASECRFGVTLDESNWTVPMAQYHFFEFVEESDLDNPNPKYLLLSELEEGKNYCTFITTYNGLYRYNMNDLVVAGPKYKNTPTIHMMQKINGIVSITGEKLYEQQFIDAVHRAERKKLLKTKFFAGFADVEKSRYDFFYEFDHPVDQKTADDFSQEVDNTLQHYNTEYAAKRKSLRLKEPKTFRLISDSFRNFKQESLKKGMRDGQFKLVHLMQDKNKESIFKRLSRKD